MVEISSVGICVQISKYKVGFEFQLVSYLDIYIVFRIFKEKAGILIKKMSVKKSSTLSHYLFSVPNILLFNPPLIPSPHRINSSGLRKLRAHRFILLIYIQKAHNYLSSVKS